MSSFNGNYLSIIDGKRRFKLPKKLRETVLSPDDRFVVSPGHDGCIFIYPADEWEKVVEKLRNLNVDSKEHRYLVRAFMPESENVKIDGVGRLTLPQRLLERAQIKKGVLILGALSHIELWAPEVYQKYIEQFNQNWEEVAERISKSSTTSEHNM